MVEMIVRVSPISFRARISFPRRKMGLTFSKSSLVVGYARVAVGLVIPFPGWLFGFRCLGQEPIPTFL